MKIDMVIYHANCMDGICAAWLLSKIFPDAEFISAHYGSDPPDVTDRRVVIADFSYPRDALEAMREQAEYLKVFDHHKTAQAALEGLEYCVFDQKLSGAGHIFKEYIGDLVDAFPTDREIATVCAIVGYIQDRDLWDFEMPFSKSINASFLSHGISFEGMDAIANKHLRIHIKEGDAILRSHEQLVDTLVEKARPITICGHEGLCVNTGLFISEVGHKLAKKADFGCMYFDLEDSRVYSLRSEGDFDVSELAKQMGGGGHKNAAGFTVTQETVRSVEPCLKQVFS